MHGVVAGMETAGGVGGGYTRSVQRVPLVQYLYDLSFIHVLTKLLHFIQFNHSSTHSKFFTNEFV